LSSRTSYALAVLVLLVAAVFRLWDITTLPSGLQPGEIDDIRITETVRQGRVEVFYALSTEGREGLYHTALTVVTGAIGGGLLGYRMLSFWAGMLALSAIYALVRRLYSPLAGLCAMALLAVSMWPILLSRTVSRETLLPLLISGVLLSLAYGLRISRLRPSHVPSTTSFTALGVLLGLGLYIHPVSFIVILMTMLFIAYFVLSRQHLSRRTLGYIGFAIVIMIVIATPYMISSIRLPDLAGPARVFEGFASVRPTPVRALGNGLPGFFLAGDKNAIFNLPGRPLIDLVSGAFMIAGLLVCLRYWRQPRFALPLIATLVLAPMGLLLADSPNWEGFTILLPLVALFFGIGVSAIFQSLPPKTRPLMGAGLVALLAFNAAWTSRDLFVLWPQLPEVQAAYNSPLGQLAHYLDLTAGTLPAVVCVPTVNSAETDGLDTFELLALMMNRQNVSIRYVDCGARANREPAGLILANGGEPQQIIVPPPEAFADINPFVHDWLMQGQPVADPSVPADSVFVLDVADRLADTIGRFTTTAQAFYAPESPGGMALTFPPVRFGGNITFLGYEPLNNTTYKRGDYLTAITYWRVDGIVPPDLRLFTHLLSDPQTIAAQSDTLSALSTQLQPRDIFVQIMVIRIPQVLQPGNYRVSVGAYEDYSDTRLNVFDGDQERGTRLFLDEIEVAGEQNG
jgi:hypothetical protein